MLGVLVDQVESQDVVCGLDQGRVKSHGYASGIELAIVPIRALEPTQSGPVQPGFHNIVTTEDEGSLGGRRSGMETENIPEIGVR